MAAMSADEIDQSHLEILEIATDLMEFFHIILEMLDNEVELGLDGGLILVFGGLKRGLEDGDVLVGPDDVRDDPANEGQRSIGLG